jgi:hypothetical protein
VRVTEKPDKRQPLSRLPACMLCVLDHLAAGLPPGPRSLLIVYGRHAHDGGCGIWPGLRSLSRELRTSPVTLRQWRDWLQDRHLIERLPRKGPHGTDLLRLGPCDHCQRQRDSMQSRCEACQRDSLQHAEPEWWAVQRDCMESRKPVLQVVPTATPVIPGSRTAVASSNGAPRHSGSAGSAVRPTDRQAAGTLRTERASATTRSTTTGVVLTVARADDDKQRNPEQQRTAGALAPFKADSHDGATVSAQAPQSREPPGAPTGDPVSSPAAADRLAGRQPAGSGA